MTSNVSKYALSIGALKALPICCLDDGQDITVTYTRRAGDFVVRVGDFSAEVAADTQQGIWVPFDEDPTGATIVAWRQHGREVNLDWFGGAGDYEGAPGTATDNWPAIIGALGTLSVDPEGASFIYHPSKKLIINDGNYYFSNSIPLRRAVWIEGAGQGLLALRSTNLFFPPNKHGFIPLYKELDWDPATGVFSVLGSHTTTAQGSLIEGVSILSTGSSTRGVGDGIHVRAAINVRNIRIAGFGGDGIHSNCDGVSNDPDVNGENNNFHYESVLIENCENGIYISNKDSSAGYGERIDTRNNRKWGIWDASFLGNTWVAPHANDNGEIYGITAIVDDGADVLVTTDAAHNLVAGDEVTLHGYEGATRLTYDLYPVEEVTSATQFRIANQQIGNAYESGGSVGYGGPFRTEHIAARSIFIGAYSEGGTQGASHFEAATIILGGLIGSVIGGFYHDPRTTFQNSISVQEPQSDVQVTLGDTSIGVALRATGPGQNQFGTQLKWFDKFQDGGSWWFMNGNGNERMLGFTTDSSGFNFGRASPVVGRPFTYALWLGGADNKARCVTYADTAPTEGEWARGDVIYNRDPAPNGYVGWVCTTGGVAGVDAVFKLFGHIES